MLFLTAFLLALIINAAPGPIFAETVRLGARGGFRPALAVQLGSLAGDAFWAVLGLAGVGLLLRSQALQLPLGLAGAAYLFWLAIDAWRAADRTFTLGAQRGPADVRRAFRAGALLSITNPQNVAYWAALGSALGAVGVSDPTTEDYAIFFAGFMTACVAWSFFCAAVVDRIFRRMGDRWVRLTYRACAIAFLALAVSSVHDLWKGRVKVAERGAAVSAPR